VSLLSSPRFLFNPPESWRHFGGGGNGGRREQNSPPPPPQFSWPESAPQRASRRRVFVHQRPRLSPSPSQLVTQRLRVSPADLDRVATPQLRCRAASNNGLQHRQPCQVNNRAPMDRANRCASREASSSRNVFSTRNRPLLVRANTSSCSATKASTTSTAITWNSCRCLPTMRSSGRDRRRCATRSVRRCCASRSRSRTTARASRSGVTSFHQEVHGTHVERPQRVLIVGRHKHDQRPPCLRQRVQDLEP
jgi:hypothetical protein